MSTLHERMALILVASHEDGQGFEVRLHDREEAAGVKAALERLGCEVILEPDEVTLTVTCPAGEHASRPPCR